MEKKEAKISLNSFLIVFLLLVVSIVIGVYLNLKPENKEQNKEKNEISNEILNNTETMKELKDSRFCIENIEADGNGYIITANLLNKDAKTISKTEYEKILKGDELLFRGLKWKILASPSNDSIVTIVSGDKKLALLYDENDQEGWIENLAGAATGGLSDYSSKKVKFSVDKNVIIGTMFTDFKYDSNGVLKIYDIEGNEITDTKIKIDDLKDWYKQATGTYEECMAYCNKDKIDAIKMFHD